MSRSGYSEDCGHWAMIRWRGAVKRAIEGERGQAFLKQMLRALDALPNKRLIPEELERDGEVCALGAVGVLRGVDMSKINLDEEGYVAANTFGIARALACEIMFENDEGAGYWKTETPEDRFLRVRAWVAGNILHEISGGPGG